LKKSVVLKSQEKSKTYDESESQSDFFKWLNLQYPQYSKLCFKIPNEGRRSYALANVFKKTGLKSGIPDVFCAIPLKDKPGLFIEFKSKGSKISPNQQFYLTEFKKVGYECAVCYSTEEAIKVFLDYMRMAKGLQDL
jgi:VRR-NUC domain